MCHFAWCSEPPTSLPTNVYIHYTGSHFDWSSGHHFVFLKAWGLNFHLRHPKNPLTHSGGRRSSAARTRYTAPGETAFACNLLVHFGLGIACLWRAVSRLHSCLLLPSHFTDILYFLLVDKYLQVFTPVSLSGECKYI